MNRLKTLTFDDINKELIAEFSEDSKILKLNMWIEDYEGDTLEDLANSIQLWVDDLRTRAYIEKSYPIN